MTSHLKSVDTLPTGAAGGHQESYHFCNQTHYCCGTTSTTGCVGAKKCRAEGGYELEGCACLPESGNDPAIKSPQATDLYIDCNPGKTPCHPSNIHDSIEQDCLDYLDLPFIKPTCAESSGRRVPRVYHAMAGGSDPPLSVQMNLLKSPGFRLNYHNDSTGLQYILKNCGRPVAEAFRCFVAPAYVSLFRLRLPD